MRPSVTVHNDSTKATTLIEAINMAKGNDKQRRDQYREMERHKKESRRKRLLRQEARKIAEDTYYENNSIRSNQEYLARYQQLPKFSMDEVELGIKLGHGGFGVVHELQKISLQSNTKRKRKSQTTDSGDAAREFMALHCRREPTNPDIEAVGDARYAIKRLRPKIVNSDVPTLAQALIDTATETRILASLPHHPNIIQLRGVSADVGNPFHEDYFLVLDRLYGTLEDKWKEWSQHERLECKAYRRILWPVLEYRRREHWRERLVACHDLASALTHLHEHGILHRDIKPQNIGFNIRGDLTLFDFGLSRSLPYAQNERNRNRRSDDEVFRLTGFCGSPRYMAPEVGLKRSYNAKCDVYSFGVLVWEILTLQKPYEECLLSDLKESVWPGTKGIVGPGDWRGSGNRSRSHYRYNKSPSKFGWSAKLPKKKKKPKPIPNEELAATIDTTFSRDLRDRPTMMELQVVFHKMCVELDGRNRIVSPSDQKEDDSLSISSSLTTDDTSSHSTQSEIKPRSTIANRYNSRRRRSTFVFHPAPRRRSSSVAHSREDNTHHGALTYSVSSGDDTQHDEDDQSDNFDDIILTNTIRH